MFELLIVGAITLIGTIVQSIAGFGVALFLTPALLFFLDPPTVILVTLLVANTICIIVLWRERSKLELSWPIVTRFVLAAAPGSIIGAFILTRINKSLLQIIIGVLIIITIIVQEYVFPKPTRQLGVSKWIGLSGFLSGIANALAAMAAPPLVLWMRSHRTTQGQMRHTLSATFLIINSVSFAIIWFLKPNALELTDIALFAIMLPIIGIGYWVGRIMAGKLSLKQYHLIIFYLVMLAGAISIIAGLSSL